ncbi:U-scoloptoxin(01)-Er1a-like [Panulirus ornatus]|uniref:U-scoloptoxin(01)-Er1a-like n=1 Tax=Panulirus ornatus TaxID=150431 RepID=UPI003A84808A
MGRLLLLAVFAVMVVCAAAGHGQDVGQPETFECLGKPDGYYADHDRNCVVYYRCAHGELTAFGCEGNTLFDETQNKCLPYDSVSC